MIELVRDAIDVHAVIKSVEDTSAGATNIFIGTTRNHSHGKKVVALEYDVYKSMALKIMAKITEEICLRWNVAKISIVHRIGKIEVGETSVVVAVSAVHRKEAFESCRYAIDELKKRAPIWKKELYENGEVWVDHPIDIDLKR
jgi:molybdopterin synthase catalytic subunit